MSDIAAANAIPPAQNPTGASAHSHSLSLWSHGSFGFKDLLDIINPLQHLPVIGSVYRYLTGDEPSGGARIVGDAIYGGPIGFGVGVVSTMLTDGDGRDLGERALAAVFGPRDESPAATAVAQAPISRQQARIVQPAIGAAQAGQALPGGPTALATQLYRSPPAPATAPAPTPTSVPTPEQNFLAQNAQFQRQIVGPRPEAGQALNNRPVPLQLTGNPMPLRPAVSMPHAGQSNPAPASFAAAAPPNSPPAPNPIAQKMLEALDKYERLKKKQDQSDNLPDNTQTGVDLSL